MTPNTAPSTNPESSVLFSLRELLALEQQRIADEAAQAEAELGDRQAAEAAQMHAAETARQRVEQSARLEELRLIQAHEEQLVRARAAGGTRRLGWALGACGAALVLGCVAFGVAFRRLSDEHQSATASLVDRSRAAERSGAERVRQWQEAEQLRRLEGLTPPLRAPAPERRPTARSQSPSGHAPPPKPVPPPEKSQCSDGDPMCAGP